MLVVDNNTSANVNINMLVVASTPQYIGNNILLTLVDNMLVKVN